MKHTPLRLVKAASSISYTNQPRCVWVCMLGLGPRLRARNSLWDLVNQHPFNTYPTTPATPTYGTQLVEGVASGLPSLPTSPTNSPSPSPKFNLRSPPSSKQSTSVDMAPVSWTPQAIPIYLGNVDADYRKRKQRGHGKKLGRTNMVRLLSSNSFGTAY